MVSSILMSPDFFAKEWPLAELDGLLSREMTDARKVILPVLHKLTHEDLLRKSPILAGKINVSTAQGLDYVVGEIIKAYELDRELSR